MRNMYPFEPIYSGRRVPVGLNSSQRGPAIIDHRTGRIFKRPDYSDIDLASVCRWFNERHKGYPPLHPPYVTITSGMSGYFAVLLVWNSDGFYEPWSTGVGRYPTAGETEEEARAWAAEEGVEYRPPGD